MKAEERLKGISRHITAIHKDNDLVSEYEDYPTDILDLLIFHKINFYLDEKAAMQSYRRLKSNFVDWNEVRISPIPEIQEALGSSDHTLTLAVFIKDLLDFCHHEKHTVDLEFLVEENITEIRRFLKRIKGVAASTINLILRQRKDYPMLPVDPLMEATLERLGLVRPRDNRDQKGKYLHHLVDDSEALHFHHFFLAHGRDICPPEEDLIRCPECDIRASCHFYQTRVKAKSRRSGSSRGTRKSTGQGTGKATRNSSKKQPQRKAGKKAAKKKSKSTGRTGGSKKRSRATSSGSSKRKKAASRSR